jgi:transportin-1
MFAFTKYQAKNLLILYDAIGTLAEAVGGELNRPEFIEVLMPPLMNRWNKLTDDDRNIFPLLECLTCIAQALKMGFAPFAAPVFGRCLAIIEKTLTAQQKAAAGVETNTPDKEFIVCALDLVAGLAEGLGPSIEGLVGKSNLLILLHECIKDEDPDVRQSAFALLGDLAKTCIGHLAPHLDKFLPLAARNLNPQFVSVCNNASWSIGEIAVKIGPEMKVHVPPLMSFLIPILNRETLITSLLENTAITIGRLGLVCPDAVAPLLDQFARVCYVTPIT